MADFSFNGYRIDVRGGGSYAANLPDINDFAYLKEGEYRVVSNTNALQIPGIPRTYQPLNQTLNRSHLWTLKSGSPYGPPLSQAYLYDFHHFPVLGIQADQSFFTCVDHSRLLSRAKEYSLQIRYAAPWMKTAWMELGQKEEPGIAANPRILEYFKSAKYWGKDDSGRVNAWCACFTSWVMEQNGYTPPAEAFRASAWAAFGKKIAAPVYGAIGIKSRQGGNHVAFVVGISPDEKYLYMLGGNQSDKVQVSRYARNVWNTFVVPADYNTALDSLPLYNKTADSADREE
jgi:uncharacterized protein (TIGR02594 family)